MKKASDIFIILLLSLFMVEMEPISLNHIVCHPDGASPQLHGFPFISHTDMPWVNSGEYVLYVKGYLLDLIFWCIFFYLTMRFIIFRIKTKPVVQRITRIILISLLMPFLSILMYFKLAHSAQFEWTHSFNMSDCPKEVVFFPRD